MIRKTSIEAYRKIKKDGTKVSQSNEIYSMIKEVPKQDKNFGLTLKEISRATGFEINAVSGRVNELKKNNKVVECSKRRCRITGRLVTPVTFV